MAKARDIPGLHPDMSYAAAASATVAVRAQELFDHAEGVLDTGDIERVHDMRVATRRLRAVLEIYAACFPAKQHRGVLRDVKALADALGARRDPDVHLDQLEALAGVLDERDRVGIELFAETLRVEQDEGNRFLAAALDHAERVELRGRLLALAASAEEEAQRSAGERNGKTGKGKGQG